MSNWKEIKNQSQHILQQQKLEAEESARLQEQMHKAAIVTVERCNKVVQSALVEYGNHLVGGRNLFFQRPWKVISDFTNHVTFENYKEERLSFSVQINKDYIWTSGRYSILDITGGADILTVTAKVTSVQLSHTLFIDMLKEFHLTMVNAPSYLTNMSTDERMKFTFVELHKHYQRA